ncbi:hypothetical protein AGABI1DRAFT_128283 [Agaricus bisporus var. burnettii JB137-S8]|uniref:pectinesterase n=1 Tax=Agaricus bisporus var. burnettii (strain JB137-S8 / ATCC MYA-4627 / FGSC 10392) TaxID=597362 RepID=K5XVF2_AGABU|nr:uncharacterized protein AGABI1DRAFT_128283 [Agaricus bisporus var. burnettii JB137-S8]EKM79120.1 hypothetical protein AGABI1DRAFT_128283 [Agaricus bisporus var. burnettii JB137-S8]
MAFEFDRHRTGITPPKRAGGYHETLNITGQSPLTLLGQLPAQTGISPLLPFYSEPPFPDNLVQVWDDRFIQTGMDDAESAVLVVAPSFDASLIGAGPTGAPLQPLFGNTDFKAYNIDFQNRAIGNWIIVGQFCNIAGIGNGYFLRKCFVLWLFLCEFPGYMVYRQKWKHSSISEPIRNLDLFGFGTAWFEHVVLANRACGGGIVAWKGTNVTDAPGNRYGAYISNSQIIRSPDANETTVTDQRCFLGRPWNDLATTVYLNTVMDNSIRPTGWTPFNSDRPVIMNTTFYAEFNSTGPGGDTSQRIPQEHLLSAREARNFTIEMVFLERPHWIDFDYLF